MKKILATGLTIGLLFSGAASAASAAFVAPDSATVLVGGTLNDPYYSINNTIDGSGLNVHNETGVLNYHFSK